MECKWCASTRYDQLAESLVGMLFIASPRYRIKFVHAAAEYLTVWKIHLNPPNPPIGD
jgi:hypothetical protein